MFLIASLLIGGVAAVLTGRHLTGVCVHNSGFDLNANPVNEEIIFNGKSRSSDPTIYQNSHAYIAWSRDEMLSVSAYLFDFLIEFNLGTIAPDDVNQVWHLFTARHPYTSDSCRKMRVWYTLLVGIYRGSKRYLNLHRSADAVHLPVLLHLSIMRLDMELRDVNSVAANSARRIALDFKSYVATQTENARYRVPEGLDSRSADIPPLVLDQRIMPSPAFGIPEDSSLVGSAFVTGFMGTMVDGLNMQQASVPISRASLLATFTDRVDFREITPFLLAAADLLLNTIYLPVDVFLDLMQLNNDGSDQIIVHSDSRSAVQISTWYSEVILSQPGKLVTDLELRVVGGTHVLPGPRAMGAIARAVCQRYTDGRSQTDSDGGQPQLPKKRSRLVSQAEAVESSRNRRPRNPPTSSLQGDSYLSEFEAEYELCLAFWFIANSEGAALSPAHVLSYVAHRRGRPVEFLTERQITHDIIANQKTIRDQCNYLLPVFPLWGEIIMPHLVPSIRYPRPSPSEEGRQELLHIVEWLETGDHKHQRPLRKEFRGLFYRSTPATELAVQRIMNAVYVPLNALVVVMESNAQMSLTFPERRDMLPHDTRTAPDVHSWYSIVVQPHAWKKLGDIGLSVFCRKGFCLVAPPPALLGTIARHTYNRYYL